MVTQLSSASLINVSSVSPKETKGSWQRVKTGVSDLCGRVSKCASDRLGQLGRFFLSLFRCFSREKSKVVNPVISSDPKTGSAENKKPQKSCLRDPGVAHSKKKVGWGVKCNHDGSVEDVYQEIKPHPNDESNIQEFQVSLKSVKEEQAPSLTRKKSQKRDRSIQQLIDNFIGALSKRPDFIPLEGKMYPKGVYSQDASGELKYLGRIGAKAYGAGVLILMSPVFVPERSQGSSPKFHVCEQSQKQELHSKQVSQNKYKKEDEWKQDFAQFLSQKLEPDQRFELKEISDYIFEVCQDWDFADLLEEYGEQSQEEMMLKDLGITADRLKQIKRRKQTRNSGCWIRPLILDSNNNVLVRVRFSVVYGSFENKPQFIIDVAEKGSVFIDLEEIQTFLNSWSYVDPTTGKTFSP